MLRLLAAGGAGLLGGALALAFGSSAIVALVAWIVAGPVAFSLLAVYTRRDDVLRAAPVYVSPSWIRPLYWTVVAVMLLGVVACAWRIADWAGRTWS